MKMKKIFLILAAAVVLSSCANAKGNKTLIEQGLSLASLMREKANSDAYFAIFGFLSGSDFELAQKIREMGEGDVSKPTAVYRVGGNFSEFYNTILSGFNDVLDDEARQLSPELKADIEKALLSGMASSLNAKQGYSRLVTAANILASETVFDCPELKEDCLYIFTFEKAHPVAVSFTRGQGNAVSAKASFLLVDDIDDELSALRSEIGSLKIKKLQ